MFHRGLLDTWKKRGQPWLVMVLLLLLPLPITAGAGCTGVDCKSICNSHLTQFSPQECDDCCSNTSTFQFIEYIYQNRVNIFCFVLLCIMLIRISINVKIHNFFQIMVRLEPMKELIKVRG